MEDLTNRTVIGPLARLSQGSTPLRESLSLTRAHKLVLVSMGGIPHTLASEHWPAIDGVTWLDASNSPSGRADIIPLQALHLPFIDVLGQCDLLICKPGYGLFAEATCNGVPILYVRREHWPEEPYLVDWLTSNNLCAELDRETFYQGAFREAVERLLESANRAHKANGTQVSPTGVEEACGHILEGLGLN